MHAFISITTPSTVAQDMFISHLTLCNSLLIVLSGCQGNLLKYWSDHTPRLFKFFQWFSITLRAILKLPTPLSKFCMIWALTWMSLSLSSLQPRHAGFLSIPWTHRALFHSNVCTNYVFYLEGSSSESSHGWFLLVIMDHGLNVTTSE